MYAIKIIMTNNGQYYAYFEHILLVRDFLIVVKMAIRRR